MKVGTITSRTVWKLKRHSAVNPLFALSFLECFLETLQEYLGEVTEVSLKDNFDVVYMVSMMIEVDERELTPYSLSKRCWTRGIR